MHEINRLRVPALRALRRRSERQPGALRGVENLTRHPRILRAALAHVLRRSSAAGFDGILPADLDPWEQLAVVEQLELELRSGAYVPQPLRAAFITSGGKRREIAIPAFRDRVAQTATRFVLESIMEPRFSNSSFGFRPGRGPHDAIYSLLKNLQTAHDVVFARLDIHRAFASVSHRRVLQQLRNHVADTRLIRRVRGWLQAQVEYGRTSRRMVRGLPMGAPLAPVLFNALLHPFDEFLAERGVYFARFADDTIVAARARDIDALVAEIRQFLGARLGLTLSVEKTLLAPLGGTLEFLGFSIGLHPEGRAWLAPGVRSRSRLRALIAETISATCYSAGDAFALLREIEARTAGWLSYFIDARALAEEANEALAAILPEPRVVHVSRSGRLVMARSKAHPAVRRAEVVPRFGDEGPAFGQARPSNEREST